MADEVVGTKEIISLKDVWVYYDSVTALEGVTLSVKQGDFLGIIGPNGGGKTTLFKVILGLIKPKTGSKVYVLGDRPERTRRFIGYVPQHPVIDRDFPASVWDVALMGRLGHKGSFRRYTHEDKQITADALREVKMFGLKDRQIGRLSWGQRQRVLIARALATGSKILLLDEPMASVDSRIEMGLYELLKKLNMKMTIILVTHDIGVISTYVKKIACLNRRLIFHDSREITSDMLDAAYHCPIEMIAHGHPHRVLAQHEEEPEQ